MLTRIGRHAVFGYALVPIMAKHGIHGDGFGFCFVTAGAGKKLFALQHAGCESCYLGRPALVLDNRLGRNILFASVTIGMRVIVTGAFLALLVGIVNVVGVSERCADGVRIRITAARTGIGIYPRLGTGCILRGRLVIVAERLHKRCIAHAADLCGGTGCRLAGRMSLCGNRLGLFAHGAVCVLTGISHNAGNRTGSGRGFRAVIPCMAERIDHLGLFCRASASIGSYAGRRTGCRLGDRTRAPFMALRRAVLVCTNRALRGVQTGCRCAELYRRRKRNNGVRIVCTSLCVHKVADSTGANVLLHAVRKANGVCAELMSVRALTVKGVLGICFVCTANGAAVVVNRRLGAVCTGHYVSKRFLLLGKIVRRKCAVLHAANRTFSLNGAGRLTADVAVQHLAAAIVAVMIVIAVTVCVLANGNRTAVVANVILVCIRMITDTAAAIFADVVAVRIRVRAEALCAAIVALVILWINIRVRAEALCAAVITVVILVGIRVCANVRCRASVASMILVFVQMAKRVALGQSADLTGLGRLTGCRRIVVSSLLTVCSIATGAFRLLCTGGRSARMTKSLALGCGAELTRLGSRASGRIPFMLAFLLAGRQRKQRAEHQHERKKCNQNFSRFSHIETLL